jgi:hypothetical protein
MPGPVRLVALLGLLAAVVGGCYVVPDPHHVPGVVPAPPPFVQATPECWWSYGLGWYGWGWYGRCP